MEVGVTVGASESDFRLVFRTYPPHKRSKISLKKTCKRTEKVCMFGYFNLHPSFIKGCGGFGRF